MVFDITSRQSFDDVQRYVEEVIRTLNMDIIEQQQDEQQQQAPQNKLVLSTTTTNNTSSNNNKMEMYAPPLILVGTKADLKDARVISFEEGKQLAEKYGMVYVETSAKENINIEHVFLMLSKEIMKKPKPTKKGWCSVM